MKIAKKELKNLVRRLLEQGELHVFDFDETLGTTEATTNLAAVRYLGGDPNDFQNSYEPVLNLSTLHDTTSLNKEYLKFLDGGTFLSDRQSGVYYPLAGAELIAVDTDQYKHWKNSIAGISPYVNAGVGLYDNIAQAAEQSEPDTVIYIRDFSPSFRLGDVKPIPQTLNIAKAQQTAGSEIGVVTARAGETDLPSMVGASMKAQNKNDIIDFGREHGIDFDFVYGAADVDPRDPSNAKRDLIGMELSQSDAEELHFYDDDIQNIRKVQQLCNQDNLSGKSINTYHADFHKGEEPEMFQCTVNELRTAIRNLIKEGLNESPGPKISRDELMNKLMSSKRPKFNIPWMKTSEEWDGTPGGIWMGAEGQPFTMNGKMMFDYYSQDYNRYDIGVYIPFMEWLDQYGYHAEWYDPGTIFIWSS